MFTNSITKRVRAKQRKDRFGEITKINDRLRAKTKIVRIREKELKDNKSLGAVAEVRGCWRQEDLDLI